MNRFDIVRLVRSPNKAASHLVGRIGVVAAINHDNDYVRTSFSGRVEAVTGVGAVREIREIYDLSEEDQFDARGALGLRRRMIEAEERKHRGAEE